MTRSQYIPRKFLLSDALPRTSVRTNGRTCTMRATFLLPPILCVALVACAGVSSPRDAAGNPQLQRLDEGEAERAAQHARALNMEDVIALERRGRTPAEIVARMRATGTRFDMDAAQQAALQRRGASAALIDALVAAEAQAKQTDRFTEEADRAAARRAADEARQEAYRAWSRDPYWWGGPYPYFGYGWYGHRRDWYGGLGWGW